MNTKHFISRMGIIAILVVLVVGFPSGSARGNALANTVKADSTPLGTAFTYQGQLTQGGSAVTGSCDFQFSLWDAETSGTQIGPTVTKSGVTVTNGLFTVQLDFGAGAFTGEARWLEIAVKCGSETLFTTLAPRQELTPAPYALYAPAAGNATTVTNGVYTSGSYSNPAWLTGLAGSKISGAVANATSATNFSGTLSGDVTGTQGATSVVALRGVGILSTAPVNGQVLQYNGSKWGPASALASLWKLTGNSGTVAGTNFLGTLDNVALEFRVNNSRALRLEPNATSPNILGGYSGNSVTDGVVGAGIGGGGMSSSPNRVTDDYGVVGGGAANQAGDNAGTTSDRDYATVGGGQSNTASGLLATVSGGESNSASYDYATVSGGFENSASGAGAFIGGGGYDYFYYDGNTAAGNAATISGGLGNQVTFGADYGTVGGGWSNTASAPATTVGGGAGNVASEFGAFIGGGGFNGTGYLGNTAAAYDATIGGGMGNQVPSGAAYATVGGGYTNTASGAGAFIGGGGFDGTSYSGNTAAANAATIGGGLGNQVQAGANYASIGGGNGNTTSGQYATVGGGYLNTASGVTATISGGRGNIASGVGAFIGGGGTDGTMNNGNTAAAKASIIGGGLGNQVNSGADYATIGGGAYNAADGSLDTIGGGDANNASGLLATIGGGQFNTASGEGSTVAGGSRAAATHFGEMAHASGDFASPGDAQTSEYVLRNTTINTTQTELFLDGSGSRLTLASGRTLSFDILIVAHSSTGGNSAGYQIRGLIENVAGATAFVGTPVVTVLGEDDSNWDATVTADNTNDALVINVTGAASTTIRWVASVRTVEVGW